MNDAPCRFLINGRCLHKEAVKEYGEDPSRAVCVQACSHYDGPSRGAGDLVAKAIKAATAGKLKPCGGCQERQRALNKKLPAKRFPRKS